MSQPSEIPPRGRALADIEREALLDDLEEMVSSSHLFKSLDEDGRRTLIGYGYVITFEDGDTIVEQGETGNTMYLVMTGTVRVETAAGPRGSIHLAELGRGACIGEVAVLTRSPRTATVTAVGSVQLVAFERHRIQRVIDAHPRVGEILEAMIEGRARDTVEKLINS